MKIPPSPEGVPNSREVLFRGFRGEFLNVRIENIPKPVRVLLIFSLIFLLGLGHSKGQHGKVNQQVQLDSVRSLIDTASDISVKVKALNRLASHDFINKESKYRDSVKYFAEMALTLASEIEDKDGIAWANMNLSNIAQRTGDIKTSFDHLQSAHSYFKLNKDSTGMGHAMSNLAQLYKDINNIEAAIKIKKEHMNLLRAKGGIWYVYGLESLGRYYQSRKNIDSSDYYLNKGFIELGKIMKSDGEYEMLNPMKNRIGALTCFLMASNDLDENRIDEAKHHIDQMRDFVLHGQSQYRAMEYDRIRALYYSAIGKYDSIQYFLMLMINKAKKLNSQISLINSYKDGAELYEKMGLDRTAITFADSALSISMVDKEIVVEKEIREIKQRAYERLGNMSESLQEAKHIAVLKDSLLSEENQ
ncbi:MAG: tetratricopeptide repeat protein [Bacteroidota bacterium]